MNISLNATIISATKITSTISFPSGAATPLTLNKNVQTTFASTDITKVVFGTYTLTGTPTVLDLTSITDAYGATQSFSNVKQLLLGNNDITNAAVVGGGSTPVLPSLPNVVPGGSINLIEAW